MSNTVPCTGNCGVANHQAGSEAARICQARTAAMAAHPAGKGRKDSPQGVMGDFGTAAGGTATPETAESLREQLSAAADPHSPEHDDTRTRLYELSVADPESNSSVMTEAEILSLVADPDGGATVDLSSMRAVTSGFAHSPYPERSMVVDAKNMKFGDLTRFRHRNADIFSTDDQAYLGLWNNPDDGKVYVDVSVVCEDAAEARADCEVNDQIAFFDLQTLESVTVNPDAKSGQGG